MGSRPPSEAGDDGWAAPPRTHRQAASGQPQLTRRDRQQVFLVQDVARELEHNSPGSIHEIKFVFSGRRLHASIVFDRHRGAGASSAAAQHGSSVDSAPASTGSRGRVGSSAGQPPTQLPSAKASEHKGPPRPTQSARLGAVQPRTRPDRAGLPAGRDRPSTEAELTKADAMSIEHTIKAAITPIVREMGGDEQNGAQYLSPPIKLALGRYKTGPIRVPLGSPAHKLYTTHSPSRCADDVGMRILRLYLDKSKNARDIERVMNHIFKPTAMTEGAAIPATTSNAVSSFDALLWAQRTARPMGGSRPPPQTKAAAAEQMMDA